MSKIHFTDATKQRKFTLTSGNDKNVILKLNPNISSYLTESELRDEIRKWASLPTELGNVTITSPSDGTRNFSGNISVSLNKNGLTLNGKYCVCFQVSSSLDFRNPEFTKWKSGTSIQSLQFNEITGLTFNTNKAIYVRAKIISVDINNKIAYSTEFSTPVSFFPTNSSYAASNVSVNINSLNGSIRYTLSSYNVNIGNPPKPNKLVVTITDTSLNRSSEFIYDIDGLGTINVDTPEHFVGKFILPGRTYRFTFNFKHISDYGVLVSPNLNVTSIVQYSGTTNSNTVTIAKAVINVSNISMVSNNVSMAKHPTFVIEGLTISYNFLSVPNDNLFVIGGNNLLEDTLSNGLFKTTVKIYEGDVRSSISTSTPVETMVNSDALFNLTNTTHLDTFLTCEATLKLSTLYTIYTTIEYTNGSSQASFVTLYTNSRTFTTPSTYVTNDVDNLQLSRTYNGLGYYGEIRTGFMDDSVSYKGKYIPNKLYNENDEILYNGELYRCINSLGTDLVDDPSTSSNFDLCQNFQDMLPSGDWLLRNLGIPYANKVYLDKDGNFIRGSNIEDLANSYDGWMKVQNKKNQILYISKRPFIFKMSALELKRRGLMSSGRTIRIGSKIFKVRLMENTTNSLVNDNFAEDKTQYELDLYQYLFTNLHTYQPEELGLSTSGTILLSNGKMNYNKESVGINVVTSEIDYDEEITGSFIVVLEDVLKGYEPYYKSLPDSPVSDLDYDVGTDTGYYGEVSNLDFITPSEFKMIYNLNGLTLYDDDVFFHKFYWHGMIIYLPNKPFGSIKVKEVIKNKMFYGLENANSFRTNGIKYKTTLLNSTNNLIISSNELDNEFEIGSFLKDLYCRVSNNLDNIKDTMFNNDKFDTNNFLDYSQYRVLLKDLVSDSSNNNNYLILNGENLISINEEESIDLVPVFITECTDYSLDLGYSETQYRQPIVTKEERTVTETYLVKEVVTKKREVIKERQVLKEKEEVSIVKTPTGKYTINYVSKDSNYDYGLILYYCNKNDLANIKENLYLKTSLNIKQTNGNNTVFYSENIRNKTEFLAKSLFVNGQNGNTGLPYHCNMFFPTMTEGMDYISNLVKVTNFMQITNNYPSKHSIMSGSLISGNISSRDIAYPYNDFYTLTNPDLDVSTIINNHVTIDEINGQLVDSWSTIVDFNGDVITFPFISPYIPYDTLSDSGKTISENFYSFLTNNNIVNTDINELCFGFVVSEISSLRYLSGGIVSGTQYSPDLVSLDPSFIIPSYFGDEDINRSNGSDFLDILNKVEVYEYKEVVTKIPYYETVSYIDFETYEEEAYVEKTKEKIVYVDIIKYL